MKLIYAFLAAGLLASPAVADTTANRLSGDELKMIAHEHAVNQMEISAGQLAMKNSTTKAVQDFGKELQLDHQKADTDMATLAKKKNAAIAKDVPETDADKQAQADDMKMMTNLKTLKGAAFDKAFLDMMAMGHQREIGKVDTFLGSVHDADLKVMLNGVKPVMQKHEDTAKQLQANAPKS